MVAEAGPLASLLAGYRGRPPADVPALVEAIVAVSRLGAWAGPAIGSLDVNPLAVLPEGQGAVALDGLIVSGA
jgi:hypothetical protein